MNVPRDFDYAKKTKYLQTALKKKLVDTNVLFLKTNVLGWEKFAKSLIEFNQEIIKSKNLRIQILLTVLMVEKILDMVLISFYKLDKHSKYDPYRFLENITLRNKIEIIKELKNAYKIIQPQESRYRPLISITSSAEGFMKFKEKYGDNFFEEIDKFNDEHDIKMGIKKPGWTIISMYPPDDDYLGDDLFKLIHKMDTGKLHKLDDYRNKIAHYLELSEMLQLAGKTEGEVTKFCGEVLYELAGIVPKKNSKS